MSEKTFWSNRAALTAARFIKVLAGLTHLAKDWNLPAIDCNCLGEVVFFLFQDLQSSRTALSLTCGMVTANSEALQSNYCSWWRTLLKRQCQAKLLRKIQEDFVALSRLFGRASQTYDAIQIAQAKETLLSHKPHNRSRRPSTCSRKICPPEPGTRA